MKTQHILDASVLTTWRKSSYSGSDNGECVEVADTRLGAVPVRDSKNPTGPALLLPTGAWSAFVAELKSGSFTAS